MELRSIAPDLPSLLAEMGVSYNPERLAQALTGREIEISSRAVQVATMLGACIAAVAKVWLSLQHWLCKHKGSHATAGHLECCLALQPKRRKYLANGRRGMQPLNRSE